MTDLGPDARDLLDATRDAEDPTAAIRGRHRAGLVSRLGAPAMATIVPATAGAATAVSVSMKAIALAMILVGGVVTTGAYVASRPAPAPSIVAAPAPSSNAAQAPSPTSRPVASSSNEASPMTSAAPSISGSPAPAATPSVASVGPSNAPADGARTPSTNTAATDTPVASASPASPSLAAELVLLRRAQAMLRNGQPELALQAVEEHERTFPNGALVEERRGVRILALCALGKRQAADEAKDFLDERSTSPLAARIRSSCPK